MNAAANVVVADATNFDSVVIEASREHPVLVDFWASWCGPCRALAPILDRMAEAFAGRMTLAKLDTDAAPDIAGRYGVRGIPNCKLFVDGNVVDEFTGALPEAQVRAFLERALPSPAAPLVEKARVLLAAGQHEAALAKLDEAAALDGAAEPLALARVEVLTALGRLDEAGALADALKQRSVQDERRLASLEAKLAVARGGAADIGALEARAATGEPGAGIDYANALAARGDAEAALQRLLDIVREHRSFGDDAARKAMLTLFEALGSDSDLVRRYRRELATALNR